jgi:transcriptional regulator with XRE-family HTH domain
VKFDELAQTWATDEKYLRARALELPKGYLGVNVFRFRAAAELTQEALAKRAGLRQPRIAEIERGDANPRLETIAKVAYALETEVADLLRNPGDTLLATDWIDLGAVDVTLRSQPAAQEELSSDLLVDWARRLPQVA